MSERRREPYATGFDQAKVPGGDVAAWGVHCRSKAVEALAARDWKGVHDWTKSWVGWGGGAWLPDAWLLYAVSALLNRQPRMAVRSIDLGLRVWLAGEGDRAILTWTRGQVVRTRLADPKTALPDLEAAMPRCPSWLTDRATAALETCREEAAVSRKRTASVEPRPEYVGPASVANAVAPAVGHHTDGGMPIVWPEVGFFFETRRPDPRPAR